MPTGTVRGIGFSRTNDSVAFAHGGSPFVSVYPWSNSTGFGAKYANPTSLPGGETYQASFN
jgi:hypothetical protein